MLQIIDHAAAITRHREHALVNAALVHSLIDLFASERKRLRIRLFTVIPVPGGRADVILSAWNDGRVVHCEEQECPPESLPKPLLEAIETQTMRFCAPEECTCGTYYCWIPALHDDEIIACLEIDSCRALTGKQMIAIDGIIRLYTNYLSLLTYSQIDTLTQLLNRKTFEDSLDKILAARDIAARQPADKERRGEAGDIDDWLAVIDIDHFKQVNDRYGHLFGDEVLILLADTMRKTFRRRDRLFRFGGEEFVVLLRHTSAQRAHQVFERFRRTVEQRNFPQVGRVTVSLGYSRIQPLDNPSDLLGRADDALYYAKRHGRNLVCNYEELAAAGHMSRHVTNTEMELF